jgi:S-adenosylmethionine decarboxylase
MILALDGYVSDRNVLRDAEEIRAFLVGIVRYLDMTIINGPTIHEFQDPDGNKAGLSGVVMIAESHCAIHTWPESKFFHLMVDSCRDFDHESVIVFAQDRLGLVQTKGVETLKGFSGPPPKWRPEYEPMSQRA